LDLRVHPALVPLDHPLSQVSLAYNAVCFDTQPAGRLLFYGEGAGGVPTSSSVISDIVSIASGNTGFKRREATMPLKNIKDIQSRYYIRCMVLDTPGVLAKIAKILSSYKISIASVHQKERKEDTFVPLVMLTHQVKEENIQSALTAIDKLKVVKKPSKIIRIEDL
jgi:homoserine dehydrogenase